MHDDLIYLDATELADRIRTGSVTSVQVVQAFLDRIAAIDPKLNAIVSLNDNALTEAQAADDALAAGKHLGPLHGVPFTVKDSIDTAHVLTQRGSPIFEGRVPDEDATAVARMKAAGGILLAKTNLPEFSYACESDNLLTGTTNNPWNLERTPGGSSGGESAAIAAGLSPIGLGTDLSISVRGPAALTGITALKPTHGRIPMTGIWPREPRRLWHVGPMARSVRDVALAYSVLNGPDGADGASVAPRGYDAGVGAAPDRPLRIGWFVDSGLGPVDPDVAQTVRNAAEALRATGATVEEVDIPALRVDNPLNLFYKQHVNELKPAVAAVTAGHEDQMYKYTKGLMETDLTPVEEYVDIEQAFDRIRDGYAEYFTQYDAVLLPVLPVPAYEHGASEFVIDGQAVHAGHVQSYTVQFSITGLPALSVRFGTSSEGLPINVQIATTWHAESTALHIGELLEQASTITTVHPNI